MKKNNGFATPVALIIFRRPQQTRQLIDALRVIAPTKMYVIADGARDDVQGEADLVAATRAEIEQIDWPAEVIKIYSDINLSLRQRVLTGLDYLFDQENEAIILEDDCIPAQSFFRFADELLDKYRFDDGVSMICGSNFSPLSQLKDSYFFYSGSLIWGWASWARTWKDFRSSPQLERWSEEEQSKVKGSFSSKIAARVFMPMMRNAQNLNTWDISLEVFLRMNSYVAILPKYNLISNVGFGEEATHTKIAPPDSQLTRFAMPFPLNHPLDAEHQPHLEKRIWRLRLARLILNLVLHPKKVAWPLVAKYAGPKKRLKTHHTR